MARIIVAVKGGKGSGFRGHAGRIGKRGGSSASTMKWYADYPAPPMKRSSSEIKGTEFGKGYYITPSGRLIDVSEEARDWKGENYHLSLLVLEKYPKVFGTDFSDISESLRRAFERGTVRVREFKDWIALQISSSREDDILHKLQSMIQNRKIGTNAREVVLDVGGGFTTVSMQDFLLADHVYDLVVSR